MHKPKNGFKGFLENWQSDLKAGFVVSLVALPISIALSLASGAPLLPVSSQHLLEVYWWLI